MVIHLIPRAVTRHNYNYRRSLFMPLMWIYKDQIKLCCVFVHISKSPQRNNDNLSFSCLCPVCVQSVIYEVKGQQVKLHADITGKPEQLLWKHNNDIIVEFNGIKEKVFGSFEGRSHLNVLTAQLQISDLRFEDTGNYEYEVYASRNFFRKSYELKVIGRKSTSLFFIIFNKNLKQ